MMRVRKKTLDKATENAISQAAAAGIPLPFDRYEDQVPVCRFGQMGLDCKVCTQGPCRVNPFDASNGTACGRDREGIVAASFLRLIADGAVASAAFAGAENSVATAVFDAIASASEGMEGPKQLLGKAIDVAGAGFKALGGAKAAPSEVRTIAVGIGALDPGRVNVLMVGGISAARAQKVAAELGSRANLVGAAGGEMAGVDVAGSYNSEEALLVTNAVDAAVIGRACVSPGFLALAARQGVPVVEADRFDATSLLRQAESHYRLNAGRNSIGKFPPATATVGFSAATFSSLSAAQWGGLGRSGIRGVALLGGCNNVMETQDGGVVRLAGELLGNNVLVVACGCAAVGLARAGYMDPARAGSLAGKGLRTFLAALSEALGTEAPAVLGAGTCWEMPAALQTADLLRQKMRLPMGAAMPEVSRPAGWSSALAVAAQGVPTYIGPVLPLDGGVASVAALNQMLNARGGSLVGPAQVGDPEAFVNMVLSRGA